MRVSKVAHVVAVQELDAAVGAVEEEDRIERLGPNLGNQVTARVPVHARWVLARRALRRVRGRLLLGGGGSALGGGGGGGCLLRGVGGAGSLVLEIHWRRWVGLLRRSLRLCLRRACRLGRRLRLRSRLRLCRARRSVRLRRLLARAVHLVQLGNFARTVRLGSSSRAWLAGRTAALIARRGALGCSHPGRERRRLCRLARGRGGWLGRHRKTGSGRRRTGSAL